MAIDPFIEAPTVRTTTVPTGGIDTDSVDRFRQGIEVTDERHRNVGVLIRLSTTRNLNHQIETNLLGQDSMFVSDGEPFAERDRFDPVKVIEYGDTLTFPIQGDGPWSLDGTIEPLTIRDTVTLDSIEAPFFAKSIKGNLQGGNEDVSLRSEVILQFIDLRLPTTQVPFLDSDEYVGQLLEGSVRVPGVFSDKVSTVHPFDDGDPRTLFAGAPSEESALSTLAIGGGPRVLSGASDMDMRPYEHKSARAGFVYGDNPEGTDSLAFGGLLRS